MTDNASVLEEIVRSLSFEVVATPNQTQKMVPSTTTKATPLSIKVKVKKKHEGGLQHGVLATSVKGLDEVPQRIRLVSSDQTIMSFDAVMEDIDYDKSKIRKPILPNIDKHPHTPSTTEACQSAGTLKNQYLLSKGEEDSNKKKDIFGRCKPGGCLDPPFGEDKYSYKPLKQEQQVQIQDAPEKKRTSSIFSNKLFNKIKKQKTNKDDVKNGKYGSNQSISSLYQTGSLQMSNSIITYPSLLKESNDKLIQDRQKSPRNSTTRKSTESDNGSLYIVTKKTRTSLEKEETKRKSERDDTNLDSSKELENMGEDEKVDPSSVHILDKRGVKYLNAETVDKTNYQEKNMLKLGNMGEDEKVDPASLNILEEGEAKYLNADTVDETNYQEKNMLHTEPKGEQCLSDNLVDNALESKQNETKDNTTSGVKTGLIAAGVAAATAGIANTHLADLKVSNKTSGDTSVDKLSDNDFEDLKVNDNDTYKTILNDNGNDINESATGNDVKTDNDFGNDTNKTILNDNGNYINESAIGNITDVKTENEIKYLKINDNDINKAILNDNGNDINESATRNITDVKTENEIKYLKINDNDTNKTIFKDNGNDINESATGNITDVKTENDIGDLEVNDNDTNKTILNDNGNDFNESATGNITDVKTENDIGDLEVNDNDTNKTILNDNGNDFNESATGNITDVETAYGSNIDGGEQLSTNNNSDVNKYEGISPEYYKMISYKDLSKIAQSDVTEGIMNTNELLNETDKYNITYPYELVSEDHRNINNMLSHNLSDIKEFDINKAQDFDLDTYVSTDHDNSSFDIEISSLDTSDKIDKQVLRLETTPPKAVVFTDPLTKDNRESDSDHQPLSTSDTNIEDPLTKDNRESDSDHQPLSTSDTNIEESDEDNQNINIRDDISAKLSQNDDDNVLVLNRQKDLQNVLEKGKEFLALDETRENHTTQSGLKREDAFEYKDMDMKQSINMIDNYGQSNISNDVIKRNISSDKLGERDDLRANLSKLNQLQPESNSESESLKKINIEKAADGDKQNKQKQSFEGFKTKIDLGLHTYTNENNELILKSFDSRTPPSRYPRDTVIVTACDLKVPFELKVPFGTEQHLSLQIKDNENLTKILPDTAISSKNSIIRKQQIPKLHTINEQMNSTVKNATKAVKLINKDIVKAQMKDIYGTYENELIPLQKSLTRLKQDVDVLILHQNTIRNNLITKRLKIQGNRKCGCTKNCNVKYR